MANGMDMDFRWKTGPGLAEQAGAGMAGYAPAQAGYGHGQSGYGQDGMTGRGQSVDGNAYGATIQRASLLTTLEQRLQSLDAQIDALEKQIGNGADYEIAAKRAETGDYSAYDNLMSRRGGNSDSVAKRIRDNLLNAQSVMHKLKTGTDEEQQDARSILEVALRKADYDAADNGVDLNSIAEYGQIKAALGQAFPSNKPKTDDPAGEGQGAPAINETQIANELEIKARGNNLHDSDIAALEKQAKDEPNSKLSGSLLELAKKYKYRTKEAKDRAKAERDAAYEDYKLVAGRSADERLDIMKDWDQKRRNRLKNYTAFDTKTGYTWTGGK